MTYYVDAYLARTRNQLTDSILNYEPLQYAQETLKTSRKNGLETVNFNFQAYGRNFNIILKRDTSLFTRDLHVEAADAFEPGNNYDGFIMDEPFSAVHGFIYNDIFEGVVFTEDNNEFHIESVHQYRHLDNQTIHSIIYNVRDIVHKVPSQCGGKKAGIPDFNSTHWYNFGEEIRVSSADGPRRKRRAVDNKNKECHLQLRADHTYVKYANNDNNRALYLLTQHVKRVNMMYQETDFNQDGQPDYYSLKIKRIGIIESSKCGSNKESQECQFQPKYIGVEKFLEIASLGNYNEYCLSYVFAHRDFSDGVLGLAWIGDPATAGGICDRQASYGGVMKSLNTGIVSNLNYGKSVPSKVTDTTLAHEIGHNYGSQHDPLSGECAPGSRNGGNYIMYPRATSGRDKNNNKFSPCSVKMMWGVIQKKGRCFAERGAAICGNRIVEKGEDCDCGYATEESCRKDTCCEGAGKDGSNKGCKYTSKAMGVYNNRCSPSNGICCDGTTCQPYRPEYGKVCAKAVECAEAAKCDNTITCPAPKTKQDNAPCNNGANTCMKGECTGSLCAAHSKRDCQCTNKADFCSVCCQDFKRLENCTVYTDNKKQKVPRPPGSPCENYEGFCDILYKCRKVDAEGPLSRLKKFIFSPKSFDTILDWMKEYWWACILIGLGSVFLMVVFIAFCSVHTPSSNPNKPHARPLGFRSRPTAPPDGPSGSAPDNPPGYDTAIRDRWRNAKTEFEMS